MRNAKASRPIALSVGVGSLLMLLGVLVVPTKSASAEQSYHGYKKWYSPTGYWCVVGECTKPTGDCCNF